MVTAFEYRLHRIGPVLAGAVSHPLQAAPEFLKLHDQLIAAAPDELSTAVSLALDPTGRPVVTVALCWCGPHDHGYTILEPLRSYGRPILNQVEPMPYADWQCGPDAGFPPGRLHYWKAGWLRDLTDATITTLVDRLQTMPSSFSGYRAATHGRRRGQDRTGSHRFRPPSRAVRHVDPLAVGRPRRLRTEHRLDPGNIRSDAAPPGRRRIRQQPRRRRPSPRASRLRDQLRATRRGETQATTPTTFSGSTRTSFPLLLDHRTPSRRPPELGRRCSGTRVETAEPRPTVRGGGPAVAIIARAGTYQSVPLLARCGGSDHSTSSSATSARASGDTEGGSLSGSAHTP